MGRGFRSAPILCLGAIAAALVSVAVSDPAQTRGAVALVDKLVERALAPEARAAFPAASVLYRGVLALVLAGLERLAPNHPRSALLDELAASLAPDVEKGWVATYGPGEIWPCDHAPAAAALRLHARLRGSAVSARAADALVARLGKAYPSRETRGTELAFTA